MSRGGLCAAFIFALLLALPLTAARAQDKAPDKTYTMKITLPTINEAQHLLAKNFAAAVREGFGRPHQGRGLSGEPVGLHSAPDRRRAVRRHSSRGHSAGVLCRGRRAFRGHGRAWARGFPAACAAHDRRPGDAENDARARRQQGAARRRHVRHPDVLHRVAHADPSSR